MPIQTLTPQSDTSKLTNGLTLPWQGVQMLFGYNHYDPKLYQVDPEQVGRGDYLNSLDARDRQASLLNRLGDQMAGRGPTVAGQQMQQGIGRALADIPSIANSARGVNRGLAQRTASLGGMLAAQQANRDAALLRAQEQLSAQQQYGQNAAAMRGGDLSARSQAIGVEQGNQQAYSAASSQKAQVSEGNAARGQKGMSGLMSAAGSLLSSDIRLKDNVEPASYFSRGFDDNYTQFEAQPWKPQEKPGEPRVESNPGPLSMIGDLFSSSDVRVKDHVRPMDTESRGIGSALRSLHPFTFGYKPEMAKVMAEDAANQAYADAMRPRLGIMAQDMNKSRLGDEATVSTPVGEMLDQKRSLGLALAGVADLDKRLARVEGRKAA